MTNEEYESYLREWDMERRSRKSPKPNEIKKYQLLLVRACLAYSKMDAYSTKPRPDLSVLKRLTRQVDITFSSALEFVQCAAYSNSEVRLWLDRDPFDHTSSSPCPQSIPRVIGSKSPECLDKRKVPYPTRTKREVKEYALLTLLENLDTFKDIFTEIHVISSIKRTKNFDFSKFLL
jgi:hypothetical protein